VLVLWSFGAFGESIVYTENKNNDDMLSLAENLLLEVKTGGSKDTVQSLLIKISQLNSAQLKAELVSDDHKKAFWINLYNAFTQLSLKEDSSLYQDRSQFFKKKRYSVAGQNLSLDDIEHGLLRKSRVKYSQGYWGKIFISSFEKSNRVDKIDYRIHFSLNCGAGSCPAIAFYTPEKIDQQLDLATKVYLKNTVQYQQNEDKVFVPKLMWWFKADFGGRSGIIHLLKKLDIIPLDAKPSIRYLPYNWELALGNYST
jgi:hypothetical protein